METKKNFMKDLVEL